MSVWKVPGLIERAREVYETGASLSKVAKTISAEFGVRLSRNAVGSKSVRERWVSIYGEAGQVRCSDAWRTKHAAVLAERCRAINSDRTIQERRLSAIRAAKDRIIMARGLHADEVQAYRDIRANHVPADVATQIIINSRRIAA